MGLKTLMERSTGISAVSKVMTIGFHITNNKTKVESIQLDKIWTIVPRLNVAWTMALIPCLLIS